jgi:hypothetical protein
MLSLRDLQAAFRDGVLGGDAAPLAAVIAGGRLAPLQRLAVHANHYRLTLLEALASTFSATRGLVGPQAFAFAARRFACERPPRDPRLWTYGAGFSGFLATLPEARELPWLPAVARLEWAMNLAFHAPDAPALDPAELAALPPAELGGARLVLHPSCGLVASRHSVLALWRAARGESAEVDPAAGGDLVLVFRLDGEAALRPLAPPEFRWLAALRAGRSAARALRAAGPGFDPAPLLAELLACGALSRVRLNPANERLEP